MIKFFNTLGHKKENFEPLKDKTVSMYVCGPTVYDYDHLGHARTFIIFDCIRRFLEAEGYKVKYLQNITDVGHLTDDADQGEDKIEKKAKEEKIDPFKISRFYEEEHFKDMAALNVLKPDLSPRATEHIKDFIKSIERLIKTKHAYPKDGNVYFDVTSFPEYGKLSGRKLDELLEAVRIEKDPRKKNPADFALWKKADPKHLMQWDSPWGKGFPGWHIECSSLAQKYLGDTLDIHGGAVELVFPHHENEIAQSESLTGRPLARFWLHTGLVTIKGQKMSKSAGNFITIKDLLKEYDLDTIRIAILRTHWRKPFDWDQTSFEEAKKLARRLERARLQRLSARLPMTGTVGQASDGEQARGEAQNVKTGYKTAIANALADDFNSPKALGIILEDMSKLSQSDFDYLEKIFGLKMRGKVKLTKKQEEMIRKREKAREENNFQKADQIRKALEKEGIILEDTTEGTRVLMDSTGSPSTLSEK